MASMTRRRQSRDATPWKGLPMQASLSFKLVIQNLSHNIIKLLTNAE